MILANYLFSEPFDWDKTNIHTLIIENSHYYYTIVSEMIFQTQGGKGNFVLSDDNLATSFYRHAEVVTDVFRLDLNDKKILNGVYKELSEIVRHDEHDNVWKLYGTINKSMFDFVADSDIDLVFDEINDITSLFKVVNLSVDAENLNLGERLLLYMKLTERFINKKLFIILNLKSCLSEKEFNAFSKDVTYRKYKVLLIETHETYRGDYETIKIIDKDLCEI